MQQSRSANNYSRNGDYYNSSYNYEKVDNMYVKEHKYYYTPSRWTVDWHLTFNKLPYTATEMAQEISRFYYHKMIDEEDYVAEMYKDISKFPQEEQVGIARKQAFYEQLWDKKVRGISPLEKAINVLKILYRAHKKDKRGEFSPMESDVDGAWDGIPDETQWDPQAEELLNVRNINDFDKQIGFLKKIAAIKEFGQSFEIKKLVEEKRVKNSIDRKQRRMNEYEEIVNLPLYQRLFPDFAAKFATKNLSVDQPVESTESKQKIIVLVDFSGSMCEEKKQEWVLAILADRLKYCMKEECEIFFSFFLTLGGLNHFKWTHIYNKETALNFWKNFNVNPSGGDTEVGLIIERIRQEVLAGKGFFNLKNIDLSKDTPEILVINDGQDTVKTNELNWKTNAITLFDTNNEQLEKLCKRTGGKYIKVDMDMHLKYS
jgi:hypothetical protein